MLFLTGVGSCAWPFCPVLLITGTASVRAGGGSSRESREGLALVPGPRWLPMTPAFANWGTRELRVRLFPDPMCQNSVTGPHGAGGGVRRALLLCLLLDRGSVQQEHRTLTLWARSSAMQVLVLHAGDCGSPVIGRGRTPHASRWTLSGYAELFPRVVAVAGAGSPQLHCGEAEVSGNHLANLPRALQFVYLLPSQGQAVVQEGALYGTLGSWLLHCGE